MNYILIAVLVIIVIVFIFTIGIFKKINFNSLSNLLLYPFSTSSFLYSPSNYGFYSSYDKPELPSGFEKKDLSPYFKKIKIESVKNLVSELPSYEEIILSADGINNKEKVDITGWSIFSNKNSFVITFGIKNLDFSLPFRESNIILEKDDKVRIYSTPSPLGVNFTLNKCSGYLNNSYPFIPKLPLNCPEHSKREIMHLSGACQEYILKLKSCEMPNFSKIPDQDIRCLNYFKTIDYNGCLKKHKNDFDFYSKQWLIFMNRNILDDLHDRILLFDRKGFLVDEYIY